MTTATHPLEDRIAAAVAACEFGKASARKGGRRSEWPYLPVIVHPDGVAVGATREETILGHAYATRDEAVAHAASVIEARRAGLAAGLADPCNRALREAHGLPRELPTGPDDARRALELLGELLELGASTDDEVLADALLGTLTGLATVAADILERRQAAR